MTERVVGHLGDARFHRRSGGPRPRVRDEWSSSRARVFGGIATDACSHVKSAVRGVRDSGWTTPEYVRQLDPVRRSWQGIFADDLDGVVTQIAACFGIGELRGSRAAVGARCF